MEQRYVYGTRTDKWYLVDSSDRDFNSGISIADFEKYGSETCKNVYLGASVL